MPRYKLTIEYDGTHYAGWQRQPDRLSVQEAIETALEKFCTKAVEVVGAGRTDAGVHATSQSAHIELEKETDPFKIMQGINYYLFAPPFTSPAQAEGIESGCGFFNRIAILNCEKVADDFHARFSAKRRQYLYRMINRRARLGLEHGRAWHVVEPLNIAAMQEAAKYLLGHHDFTSFRDTQCQSKSPLKTLEHLQIMQNGDQVWITANARSFLHHQVRIMVGTLALVGKSKWHPDDVKKALEAKDRKASGPTAPPEGLYLVGVDY